MSFKKQSLLFKVLFLGFFIFPIITFASTTDGTILNPDQYAWGENVGWVNFGTTEGDVHVTNTGLTGYMWDATHGWVNLNPTGSGVLNDGNGNLSGFAWSAGTGFIDFTGVVINGSGKFTGQAQGVAYGRINFDCSTCNVLTDWRPISQQTQNISVGPISVFLNNHSNIDTGTTSQIINEEPTMSPLDFIGYIKQLFTGKKSQNTSTSIEIKNPINYQPVVNESGLPVIKKPNGKIFSTTPQDQSKTGSEIAIDIIVKAFKAIVAWFSGIFSGVIEFITVLPGSVVIKSFIFILILIILVIIWKVLRRNKTDN